MGPIAAGGTDRVSQPRNSPVRTFVDPRVEIYAPTGSRPYYRVVAYDSADKRVLNTSGGKTLKRALAKAAEVALRLRKQGSSRRDPTKMRVATEAVQWLDPANHRSRGNKPWSNRHAENMRREWELRIEPHLSPRAAVAELTEKHFWIRVLNTAEASGLAPSSVQKTGQACRSFVTWLMDRGLLERNPMHGVSYSMTKADNAGYDPKAVTPDMIPNLDMVYPLGYWMARLAWPLRPDNGGSRVPDAVGTKGRALQPMLTAMTGLRNGEMFALRPSRIDLDALEVRIDSQIVEEDSGERYEAQPKHGSLRVVMVAGFLRDDLGELIEHRRQVSGERDPLLFSAPSGGLEWRRNHGRRFRNAADRAGWPRTLTWYGLRHLYAVTMLEHLPLEVVSRLMGHHSPDFTAKRYLSLRMGWLDQARAAARTFDPS